MSALERRAQPFLQPLVAGRASSLESAAKAAIATWAVKTAMVFEGIRVEGDCFYSADDRRLVREQQRPPSRTSVWLGKYVGNAVAFTHASDLGGSVDDGRPMQIHLTTLAFGRVVIQISSGRLPDDIPLNTVVDVDMTDGPWNEATVRIWPMAPEPARWPPAVPLVDSGEASLERFCDRWGGTETAVPVNARSPR